MLVLELLSNSPTKIVIQPQDLLPMILEVNVYFILHHSIQLALFIQHRCPLDSCQLRTST